MTSITPSSAPEALGTAHHTLTVERITDVPELAGTRIHAEAIRNTFSGPTHVIVERRDGQFVTHHGTNVSRWWWQDQHCHIWDAARSLADLLSSRRGEHENLRYVGPGPARDVQASQVREGWYVHLGAGDPWLRVAEVRHTVSLAVMRRTGQMRPKKVVLVLEGGRTVTLSRSATVTARRAYADQGGAA
jgi:hypothetical protein